VFEDYFQKIISRNRFFINSLPIVSINPAQVTSKHKHFCCPCPKWADFVYSFILD